LPIELFFMRNSFCINKNSNKMQYSFSSTLTLNFLNLANSVVALCSGVARVFAARGGLKNAAPYFCSKNL